MIKVFHLRYIIYLYIAFCWAHNRFFSMNLEYDKIPAQIYFSQIEKLLDILLCIRVKPQQYLLPTWFYWSWRQVLIPSAKAWQDLLLGTITQVKATKSHLQCRCVSKAKETREWNFQMQLKYFVPIEYCSRAAATSCILFNCGNIHYHFNANSSL